MPVGGRTIEWHGIPALCVLCVCVRVFLSFLRKTRRSREGEARDECVKIHSPGTNAGVAEQRRSTGKGDSSRSTGEGDRYREREEEERWL